jgi:dUTP pyrophosphatase
MFLFKLYLFPEEEVKEWYLNKITNSENYTNDSGFDLYSPSEVDLNPGDVKCIDYRIKCKMVIINDKGEESPSAFYVYSRSSISKTPLILGNGVGIIDMNYRGNIYLSIRNVSNDQKYTIDMKQRLFQICSPTLDPFSVEIVDGLDTTDRGNNGLGSTGK